MGIALSASMIWAQDNTESIAEKIQVHRLTSAKRAPFDAFVYANRIPESAGPSESSTDFAGRIFGRLANQEGRVLLKLPPGMDRKAYLGFKTFLGSEGDEQVSNCVTCHAPAEFTDGKSHVVSRGGSAKATPSLRNLKTRKVDIQTVVLEKLTASRQKQSGQADVIDDAYARMNITEADVPNLVAFLNSLEDVADADFRGLIVNAEVLDTSQTIESKEIKRNSAATVVGVVRFEGPPPERQRLQLTPESAKLYEADPLDEDVMIGEGGGLANAFVYVKKGLEKKDYPLPAESAVLNQEKSMFRPRVQGVRIGQEFVTKNSDPFIHNVRSLSLKNRAFNVAQPPNTPDRTRVFTRPEGPIRLGCDFHRWMTAFIFVLDHPFYAVTDEEGRFRIEALPVGEYTLAAWHEKFGEQQAKIAVGSSGSAEVGFTFKPKERHR